MSREKHTGVICVPNYDQINLLAKNLQMQRPDFQNQIELALKHAEKKENKKQRDNLLSIFFKKKKNENRIYRIRQWS